MIYLSTFLIAIAQNLLTTLNFDKQVEKIYISPSNVLKYYKGDPNYYLLNDLKISKQVGKLLRLQRKRGQLLAATERGQKQVGVRILKMLQNVPEVFFQKNYEIGQIIDFCFIGETIIGMTISKSIFQITLNLQLKSMEFQQLFQFDHQTPASSSHFFKCSRDMHTLLAGNQQSLPKFLFQRVNGNKWVIHQIAQNLQNQQVQVFDSGIVYCHLGYLTRQQYNQAGLARTIKLNLQGCIQQNKQFNKRLLSCTWNADYCMVNYKGQLRAYRFNKVKLNYQPFQIITSPNAMSQVFEQTQQRIFLQGYLKSRFFQWKFCGSLYEISNQCAQCLWFLDKSISTTKHKYTCQPCAEGCNLCKQSTLNCQSCLDGYQLQGNTCKFICDSSCKTCQLRMFTLCISCFTAHYLKGSSCLKCGVECQICQSSIKCLSCREDFQIDINSKGRCILKCKAPCLTCFKQASSCSSCIQPYNLVGQQCKWICRQAKCLTCKSSPMQCDQCLFPYIVQNKKCIKKLWINKCNSPCSKCLSNKDCLACFQPFFLSGTKCHCPVATYRYNNQCFDIGNSKDKILQLRLQQAIQNSNMIIISIIVKGFLPKKLKQNLVGSIINLTLQVNSSSKKRRLQQNLVKSTVKSFELDRLIINTFIPQVQQQFKVTLNYSILLLQFPDSAFRQQTLPQYPMLLLPSHQLQLHYRKSQNYYRLGMGLGIFSILSDILLAFSSLRPREFHTLFFMVGCLYLIKTQTVGIQRSLYQGLLAGTGLNYWKILNDPFKSLFDPISNAGISIFILVVGIIIMLIINVKKSMQINNFSINSLLQFDFKAVEQGSDFSFKFRFKKVLLKIIHICFQILLFYCVSFIATSRHVTGQASLPISFRIMIAIIQTQILIVKNQQLLVIFNTWTQIIFQLLFPVVYVFGGNSNSVSAVVIIMFFRKLNNLHLDQWKQLVQNLWESSVVILAVCWDNYICNFVVLTLTVAIKFLFMFLDLRKCQQKTYAEEQMGSEKKLVKE